MFSQKLCQIKVKIITDKNLVIINENTETMELPNDKKVINSGRNSCF